MRKGRMAQPVKKENRTTWSKVTKALRFLLSSSASNKDLQRRPTNGGTRRTSPTRTGTVVNHRRATTQDSTFAFPRTQPASQSDEHRLYRNSSRRKTSISKRRGVPTLPPVDPGYLPFDFPPPSQQRRSKSLSGIPSRPTVQHKQSFSTTLTSEKRPDLQHSRTQSSNNSRKSRPSRSSMLSRKLSLSRKQPAIDISPPIPQRPAQDLGINSQFKTPGLDRSQIQEMAGFGGEPEGLDGSTLVGSYADSNRSRVGTGGSDRQPVANKPLPKLPHKFSMFPPPSPPRTPLDLVPNRRREIETDSRPTTANSMKISLKRIASAGALQTTSGNRPKRNISYGGFI